MDPSSQDPVDRLRQAHDQIEADLHRRRDAVAEARSAADAVYADYEAAIARAVGALGVTEVTKICGFKSRTSVVGIVAKFKEARRASGPTDDDG